MVLVRSLLSAPTLTLTPARGILFPSRFSTRSSGCSVIRRSIPVQCEVRSLGDRSPTLADGATTLEHAPQIRKCQQNEGLIRNWRIVNYGIRSTTSDEWACGRRRRTEVRCVGTLASQEKLAISFSVNVEESISTDSTAQAAVDQLEIDGPKVLKLVAKELDEVEDTDTVELSLLLCNDAYIQSLNSKWLGKDCPTDVLSFPQDQAPGFTPHLLLGDIVISLDTAARQAEERGHTLLDELRILLVHGLLHLLGYDHELGKEPSRAMEEEEARVLRELEWNEKGLINATQESFREDSKTNDQPARKRAPKPPFKYLFCDMDGTLLDGKCVVTDASADAIKAAVAKGVQVVIATGKTQHAAMVALDPVGLSGDRGIVSSSKPGVFLQGLQVYGKGGTVVYTSNLDSDIVRESFNYSLEKNISTLGFSSNRIVTLFRSELTDILHEFYLEPKAEVISSIDELVASFPVQKMLFYSTPELVKNEIRPFWASKIKGRATLIQAVDTMLEMLPLGQSKANGLKILLDSLGVSPDEVMAIGDGENDIGMLSMVGWGVVMANGCEEAKAVANAMTASNDEEGVAQAIHRYILS